MKCPNCFCAIAESVKTCPCCGYVIENLYAEDAERQNTPAASNTNQVCVYPTSDEHAENKKKSRKDRLKTNIIIILLAIDILLNLLDLILK